MSRKKPKPTTITIYPGIDIVAQPGTSTIALGAIQLRLAELQDSLIQEQIADLFDDAEDRYEVADVLCKHPERLDEIAKLIKKRHHFEKHGDLKGWRTA